MCALFRSFAILSLLFVAGVVLPRHVQAQSATCQAFNTAGLAGSGLTAGLSNGLPGAFAPGDVITISATLNTASAGTFSIVGNFAAPILVGPTAIPGTLTYTVTGPLPTGSVGVGWYINSATGGTVNITSATCTGSSVPAPALGAYGTLAAATLIAIFGAMWFSRRYRFGTKRIR